MTAPELLASPVGTIAETDFDTCVEKSQQRKERRAACIVVGYPKNMNGTIGERAERCQQFAACLKEKQIFQRCSGMNAAQPLPPTSI